MLFGIINMFELVHKQKKDFNVAGGFDKYFFHPIYQFSENKKKINQDKSFVNCRKTLVF